MSTAEFSPILTLQTPWRAKSLIQISTLTTLGHEGYQVNHDSTGASTVTRGNRHKHVIDESGTTHNPGQTSGPI